LDNAKDDIEAEISRKKTLYSINVKVRMLSEIKLTHFCIAQVAEIWQTYRGITQTKGKN
jgi:hypothetical protein